MKKILIKYIIDSNIFMEASRRYYAIDFAKPFWDSLCNFAEQGKIISIDRVFDEICEGNDSLKVWAQNDFFSHFKSSQTDEVLKSYRKIVRWANLQSQFNQNAKNTFMEETNADAWVIAYALAYNCKVVTSEVINNSIQKSIPIPNVCNAFSIESCDTFQMLRDLDFSF